MRIMIVSGSVPPEPCGVGDHAARLARELSEREGVEVAILTSEWIKPEPQGKVAFFPLVKRGPGGLRAAFASLVEWKPDIVHIQWPTQGYASWHYKQNLLPLLAWMRGVPLVFSWHEPLVLDAFNPLKSLPLTLHGLIRGFGYACKTIMHDSWISALLPGGLVLVRENFWQLAPFWLRCLRWRKTTIQVQNGPTLPKSCLADSEILALRRRWTSDGKKIVLYFGFASPHKGVHLLFDIADPAEHTVLMSFHHDPNDPYHAEITERSRSATWAGNAHLLGFLPNEDLANLIALADAVVLPFTEGGGVWNTSALAVQNQGTFLMTTSQKKQGYVSEENTFYVAPGDLKSLREGLCTYMGRKSNGEGYGQAIWTRQVDDHISLYRKLKRQ